MIIRNFKKTLFLLLAAVGMAGCVQEYIGSEVPVPANGDEVTITVNIPGLHTPSTRSIKDGDGEAAVKNVYVLVFKSGSNPGDPEVLAEHVAGDFVSQSSSSSENYKVQFKVKLKTEPTATTVVILANTPAETITAATGYTNKQDVLSALTYASSNSGDGSDGWKWNATSSGNYTPIPMYGEYDVTKGGDNQNGLTSDMEMDGIDLVRMLARIDVVDQTDESFKLNGVYLVNYNTAGYIEPKWNEEEEPVLNIPDSPNPQIGEINAMNYPYSAPLTGEIYVYEAAATSGNEGNASHTNAICLIVRGTRLGETQDSYYRIDFTAGTDAAGKVPGAEGFDPSTVEYMPVYRNHKYVFSINEVNGPGYTNFGDALRSLGILNNLKTNMLVVDERGLINTVFNGRNYLSLSDDVLFLPSSGLTAEASCTTDYQGGWVLDGSYGSGTGITYEGTDNGWLSVTADNTDLSGKLQLTTLTSNAGSADRVAYVHVKAGTLTHELKVTHHCAYIRIVDANGNIVPSLVFGGKVNVVPAPQTFTVVWEPSSETVNISKTSGTYPFTWQDVTTNSLTSLPAGGSYTFTINPAALTQAELTAANNPFLEKNTTLNFTVNNSSITADILLRQYANNLSTNVKPYYMLDSQTETLNVKANFPWKIAAFSDPDDIILDASQTVFATTVTGGNDTSVGTTFTFKMEALTPDFSKSGKTATITFQNTLDGSLWVVTIKAVEALPVGMFAGNLVDKGGYWQFERPLLVQHNNQGASTVVWKTAAGAATTGTDDKMNGRGNTWNMRTGHPAGELCINKNTTYPTSANNLVWYLPAIKQLMAIYVVHAGFDSPSTKNDSYWSSTQRQNDQAWTVHLETGTIDIRSKRNDKRKVRCVREP